MKYLVTGGEGFIGSHTVENLIKEGHEVIVIDDNSAPENSEFFKFAGAKYIHGDINAMGGIFYEGVDVVIHLAARSRIQPSFGSPRHTYENNVMGTQLVLENATRAGVKRVVYAGSSSCYGLATTPPFKEDSPADCLNHYALSKMQGEQLCRLYSRIYGIETVVLRYFNVYGVREPIAGVYAPVIGIFKRQRDAGELLTIVGDGEQRRDFTHVSDVAKANIIASTHPSESLFSPGSHTSNTFNVGTGTNYTINEIAEMIGGKVSHIPVRKGEARNTLADVSKIEKVFGWKPTVSLRNVINNYY